MSEIYFYKYLVTPQVFFKSKYTYALVNIKPLLPGHVLVVPLRTSVLRFGDLTTEESQDYMDTLQLVHKLILWVYKADSLNIAIQDGPESGQSVPHLHTHLIPRHRNDGYINDKLHRLLEDYDIEANYADFEARKKSFRDIEVPFVLETERVERTPEVMHQEASWLAQELTKYRQQLEKE